jgi:hypothetical protein
MKRILLSVILLFLGSASFSQSNLISYDDLNYLLHNNITKADSFFSAKGYALTKKDQKKNLRVYHFTIPGGTYVTINLRSDGKRIFAEIETNEMAQYNMIYNSISQYVNKESTTPDVQMFTVKDLGEIYIMVNDAVPYNPIRREFSIRIVSDKSITAYN